MEVDVEGRWLTKQQVMKYEKKRQSWVERRAEKLGRRDGPRQRNGRCTPLYDALRMSAAAQRRWAADRKVVPLTAVADGEDSGQLALDLAIPAGMQLAAMERAEAEWRFTVLAPLIEPRKHRAIWEQAGGNRGEVVRLLAKLHERSVRTIYDWLSRWEGKKDPSRRGLVALVDPPRKDKGKSRVMTPAARDFLVKVLAPLEGSNGYGEYSLRQAYEIYREEAELRGRWIGRQLEAKSTGLEACATGLATRLASYIDEDGRLSEEAALGECSYSTFRRWARQIPAAALKLARNGRDKYDASELAYSYRDYSKLLPLDWVVMDHRQLDIFCLLPQRGGGWKLGRPWLTAAMDMRSRRWLGWTIVAQPDSHSIATVVKRVILSHGIPGHFYWDNGQDFECSWLNGVMESLGVRVTHSLVKRARSKTIEPNFRRVAVFERTTEWWCGHKPDARPERLEKLLKAHEKWMAGASEERPFQTLDEVSHLYQTLQDELNATAVEGEGMQKVTPEGRGWLTPDECWDLLAGQVIKRVAPRETLLFLFRDRRRATVRHSQIVMSFHGSRYVYQPSPEDDPLALAPLNGREVEVAIDPLDLETAAVFFDGRLVCMGRNLELRGMGEDAFKRDEADRRRLYKQHREMIAAAHERLGLETPAERLARRQKERSGQAKKPVERPEVVVAFPEAQRAVAAAGGAQARMPVPQELAAHEEVIDDDPAAEFDFFGR